MKIIAAESELAATIATLPFSGIAIDSRAVQPGDLFVALRGEHVDGRRFVTDAFEAGAAAVVCEAPCDDTAQGTLIVVPDATRALSRIAAAFYGRPSEALTVAGVTGTNGKTTTVAMLGAVFNAAGMSAGTIGTLGARFADAAWNLRHTTPLAHELQRILAEMRDKGSRSVAMEVSSHALATDRVADVCFRVAALTNVTRDHLDFHGTFENYAAAKRSLFERAQRCVFNADCEQGVRWADEVRGTKPLLTYALQAPADVRAEAVELHAEGSRFRSAGTSFELHLPGRFNVTNALAAIAVARSLDIADAHAAEGLASIVSVRGRMERIAANGIQVVVDYSHTPDSLENALRTLRETTRGKLIAVFGCGGDRDRGKRPLMGAVAAQFADFTYVTSDNPRSEAPLAIIGDIVPALEAVPHAVEPDRARAICASIRQARPGDAVLIAGKGHETYQIAGTQVLEFDDAAVAREALADCVQA